MPRRPPGRTALPMTEVTRNLAKASAPSGSPSLGRRSGPAARPGGPRWPTVWRLLGPVGPRKQRLPSPRP
eukprot:994494-Alexandrium_andersonii.AAC.1